MTTNTSTDAEDFSEEFVDPEVHIHVPSPLAYAPWHKPRKQFVRIEQWLRHTSGLVDFLIEKQHFEGGVPFKYMTLPGPDLLDIQLVRDVCSDKGIKLHFTGFCSASEEEETRLRKNVSQFSYDFSTDVAEGSQITPAKLEDIVVRGSDAHTSLERGGPFDVINIDACKPLLRQGTNIAGRLIDAVRSIIQYQVSNRAMPWVILLTTPIQVEDIANDSKESIYNEITLNTERDEEFSDALAQHIAEGEGLEEFLSRLGRVNGIDFIRIITLGISKWFLHLGEQANFRVKKMNGYCYSMFREEPFDPNMISVCYLFEPQPVELEDGTGLTSNTPANEGGTPPKSDHIRALEKSFGMEDVDVKMAENHEQYENLIVQSMDILRAVGYPVDDPEKGYRIWLEQEPSHALVLRGAND